MATKIKALQQWCRKMVDGYRDVDITDFTTSWRSGLAFCAIIHRFRPDLIDYDSLSKENIFENNHLAFTVAEKELDIPAFLEASDMVALKTPDKLSVITYVSQYYNQLHSLPQLGGPGIREKTTPTAITAGTKRHQKAEPLSEPEPKKQPLTRQPEDSDDKKAKGRSVGDMCAICKGRVYLLERRLEDGQLYHRSCFRQSDLSPNNAVFTRSPFMSPSLQGKDKRSTPTTKPSAFMSSLDKVTDASSAYVNESKFGLRRSPRGTENADKSMGSDTQKSVHSDLTKMGGKSPNRSKSFAGHSVSGSNDSSAKHRQFPGKLNIPSPPQETHDLNQTEKKLSPTPKFDARNFEKHSMDFLSSEKNIKDLNSSKRQLPLIFQANKNASDVSDTSESMSDKNTASIPQKTVGSKSAMSALSENNDGAPVAKPRVVKKLADGMDTSELVKSKNKSPLAPSPSPRISVASAEGSQKVDLNETSSSQASSARSLSSEPCSPPPLPASAPPPVTVSASSASPQPSPRHKLKRAVSHRNSDLPSSDSALLSSKAGLRSPEGKSSTGNDRQVSSMFISISTPSNKSGEEPMDVDSESSKTLSPYRKEPTNKVAAASKNRQKDTGRTDITSLAHVRTTPSDAESSSSGMSSSSSSSEQTSKDMDNLPGKRLNSTKGFVSSKVSQWQNKDSDQKRDSVSVSNVKDKNDKLSPRDSLAGKTSGPGLSPRKTGVQGVLASEKTQTAKDIQVVLRLSDMKHGDTVTVKPTMEGDAQGDSDKRKTSVLPRKTDRAKSSADIHDTKMLSSKPTTTAPDPPPFTQVKLRESGYATLERNERSKSAGNVFDKQPEKSEWQLDAERRMAALRDTGFVDPESKKSTSSCGSPTEDDECVNKGKEGDSPTLLQTFATNIKKYTDRVKEFVEKDDEQSGKARKKSISAAGAEKEESGKAKFNLDLKGILKSEKERSPPSKPERFSIHRDMKGAETSSGGTPKTQDSPLDINTKNIRGDNVKTTPPPRPTSPPKLHHSKLSVDAKFQSSNSVGLTSKTEETSDVNHTAPASSPPARKTSISSGRLSAIELQQQLKDIDSKLSELELRGRQLEDTIRSVDAEEEDDVMWGWFQLVTEKNNLIRQEANLIYMSREQDLEDEQSKIESQLLYLLNKDESEKTSEELKEEEYLIQRKVDIVNQRNTIVDNMDEDRLRYEEEDRDIAQAYQEKSLPKESVSPAVREKSKTEKEKGKSTKKKDKPPKVKDKSLKEKEQSPKGKEKIGKKDGKEKCKTEDEQRVGLSKFYT